MIVERLFRVKRPLTQKSPFYMHTWEERKNCLATSCNVPVLLIFSGNVVAVTNLGPQQTALETWTAFAEESCAEKKFRLFLAGIIKVRGKILYFKLQKTTLVKTVRIEEGNKKGLTNKQ